jgi:magnesium chelatase family protein
MNHSSAIIPSACLPLPVSDADLTGSPWPKPGEISLAHRSGPYLDEPPAFGLWMLEMLYQPLEDKLVAISRSAGSLIDAGNFILVAGSNPYSCGFYSAPERKYIYSISMVKAYQNKRSTLWGKHPDC